MLSYHTFGATLALHSIAAKISQKQTLSLTIDADWEPTRYKAVLQDINSEDEKGKSVKDRLYKYLLTPRSNSPRKIHDSTAHTSVSRRQFHLCYCRLSQSDEESSATAGSQTFQGRALDSAREAQRNKCRTRSFLQGLRIRVADSSRTQTSKQGT